MPDALICARTARGTKRRCPSCEQAFYDLKRATVECPYCGQTVKVTAEKNRGDVTDPPRRSRVKWHDSAAPLAIAKTEEQPDIDE